LHKTHRWPIPGWSARSGDDFRSPSVRKFIRFPLTNNTAARKACALPASRNAGAFGELRAACVRCCADLGCPRITPRFIQNAPRDSILSCADEARDRCPVRAGYAEAWSVRTASGECCLEKEV